MQLNKRCIGILQHLIQSYDFVKTQELAEKYKVTPRTIRYDLDKIERFLVKNGFDYFERHHINGIKLKRQEGLEDFINTFISTETPYKYVYSKSERSTIMILELLQANKPLKIGFFEKKLYVSRNTVLKELDNVEKWLKKRKLSLIRKPRIGLLIEGSELDKRKAIIECTSENISLEEIYGYINRKIAVSKINNIQFDLLFSEIDIDFLNNLINYAEHKLNKKFSDDGYGNLITHVAIMIKRLQLNKEIYIPNINVEGIEGSREYQVSKEIISKIEDKFNIKVPKVELDYIALHLLGAKSLKDSELEENELSGIVEKMIEEIEGIYKVSFEDRNKIIDDLIVHFRPMIYRVKFGLHQKNPLHNKIISKYRELFLNTKLVARHLEDYLGSSINEHEISYIALHFGAALENAVDNKIKNVRVIVVCGTGIGTAKMVASKLIREFNVEIVDTISSREISKIEEKEFDLIISTVDIPEYVQKDYVKISPLFLKKDYKKLKDYLQMKYEVKSNYDYILVDKLMKVIEKYCDIKDRGLLEYEIMYELKENQKSFLNERRTYMLNDLLTREVIELNVEAREWKEAIKKGADLLSKKGYITDEYVNAIYNNFKEVGPYMVVAPGIVLAHARPEDGVNRLCMSLITLSSPVRFGHETNDPVKMIVTFAAVDNKSHLKALSQLMELFMNTNDLNQVMNATNKEEVLSVINKYSHK
ncbi:PTS system, IIA component [Caldisalinibacter kiritimatiensis]|uniref:PTS system, IIA component n=2 Tax=Caldisalinibacter kiritimatiensis TaxID=1304284 RepID=R1ASB2_9FIRM|nr:PTS system, IIA component [Caldisalinibacter kiritimatiensis]